MGLEDGGADHRGSGSLSPPSRVSPTRVGSGFGERGAACWGGEGRARCRLSHLEAGAPRSPGRAGPPFHPEDEDNTTHDSIFASEWMDGLARMTVHV